MSVRITNEVPTGAVDGVNQIFVLAASVIGNSLVVFYRGQKIDATSVSLATDNRTFTIIFAPESATPTDGNILECEYESFSTLWVERT